MGYIWGTSIRYITFLELKYCILMFNCKLQELEWRTISPWNHFYHNVSTLRRKLKSGNKAVEINFIFWFNLINKFFLLIQCFFIIIFLGGQGLIPRLQKNDPIEELELLGFVISVLESSTLSKKKWVPRGALWKWTIAWQNKRALSSHLNKFNSFR